MKLVLSMLAAMVGAACAQTDCDETVGACLDTCADKTQTITAEADGGTACTTDLSCAAGDGDCLAVACDETVGACLDTCADKTQTITAEAIGGGAACTTDLACAAGDGACPAACEASADSGDCCDTQAAACDADTDCGATLAALDTACDCDEGDACRTCFAAFEDTRATGDLGAALADCFDVAEPGPDCTAETTACAADTDCLAAYTADYEGVPNGAYVAVQASGEIGAAWGLCVNPPRACPNDATQSDQSAVHTACTSDTDCNAIFVTLEQTSTQEDLDATACCANVLCAAMVSCFTDLACVVAAPAVAPAPVAAGAASTAAGAAALIVAAVANLA